MHVEFDLDTFDEQSLLAGLRAGRAEAFEFMVRAYGGRLLAVATRMLRDHEDARDAVQNAYLSAFRALPNFKGDCQISTWLHRIVVNAALMKIRSRRNRPERSIEPLLPVFTDEGHHATPFSHDDLPADVKLERAESLAVVRECINELPETYRTILIMRDAEDLSTAEVAAMLGITPNAAKIRLHRARQALTTLVRREMARREASVRVRQPVLAAV